MKTTARRCWSTPIAEIVHHGDDFVQVAIDEEQEEQEEDRVKVRKFKSVLQTAGHWAKAKIMV